MNRQLHLMPASAVRRRAIHEGFAIWSRVFLAAALICAIAGAIEAWQCRKSGQVLAALENQHGPVKQLIGDIRMLRAEIERLTASEQLALELASTQSAVTLLAQIGRAAAYAGGDLFVESLDFERQPASQSNGNARVLRLEGVALNHLAATRFVEQLRETQMFAEVNLASTASRVLATQPATAFEVECVF
ncbi:MAG: PilN domain-containing protein [Planctomycetota bacterium]